MGSAADEKLTLSPWMTENEINLFRSYLRKDKVVLEWGAGGSTIEFSKYVKEYYSVEHDFTYYLETSKRICKNVKLYYVPSNTIDLKWDPVFAEGTYADFKDYVNFADSIASLGKKFDIVLIDGRARVDCALKVLPHLAKNAVIFIHDFEGAYYWDVLKNYEICGCVGKLAALKEKKSIFSDDRIALVNFFLLNGLSKNNYDELSYIPVKLLHGPDQIKYSQGEVVVLCLVRNGEQLIEKFIEHYFKLGAKHIVFLDNGSNDRTVRIASGYNNVTILKTGFPFGIGNNKKMRAYLMDKFTQNKWSLFADIDEFFDFQFSGTLGFEGLVEYLNKNNYTAVISQMLDMFSENILRGQTKKFNREEHKYYCLDNIVKRDYCFENGVCVKTDIKLHSGGMRGKLFGIDELCLTKHALILNNTETERGKGWHLLTKGKIADFSAVLFHYKFTDDFYSRVEDAVRNEQYWNYSAEYKKYHSKLAGHDVLDLKDESSKTFNAMEDLIFNNFLVVSRDLEDFARHYKNG